MDIVKFSIEKPVTILVGIILVVLFGMISLFRMPYQLSPSVTEPEITVTTTWTGATPYEVERDIIEEQEKVLKGIPGLIEMESSSRNGAGTLTLRFKIGTNVDDALLRVSNKLNEVRSYPENVDKPVISATGAATSPVIWIVMKTTDDNPHHINTYRTFFENEIKQYFERVEGVADLFVVGGREKEMHVVLDPEKLAAYRLTINDVVNTLREENVNISAGNMGVGRRNYRIRSVSEFHSPEDIENVVIRSTGQQRVFLSDVARVHFGYEKLSAAMIHMDEDGISMGVKPEPGTNILDLTDNVEKTATWVQQTILAPEKLYLDWAYDQRPYIRGAIDLVRRNILIGGLLAVIVLIVFLRNVSSTFVAASAIPISAVGSFIFLNALGRNLNVVSLAGIAFAVGMLVDSAIVVLENIDRHRNLGKSSFEAAYAGTTEVWGAIFASTLTTIAVFLPVAFVQEEAGQLFRDIAIAITFAVTLGLFVAVSVIPMFSKRALALSGRKSGGRRGPLTWLGGKLTDGLMAVVKTVIKNWVTRLVTIIALTGLAVLSVLVLFPKMEYLPQGNRNFIANILIPPPGLSYEERHKIGKYLFDQVSPYMGRGSGPYPGIKMMFYAGAEEIMLSGVSSLEEQRAGDLVPLLSRVINSIPGMFGVSAQAGIFQERIGGGRTIDVDIRSEDLNRAVQVGGAMFGMIMNVIPESQVRPVPSLEIMYPEVKLIPDRDRLKASGMSARDFGVAVDVLMDGRKIGDFKQEGEKKIDLVLKASETEITTPEALYKTQIAIPRGNIIPLASLARFERTSGITEIRHLERLRTVTLQVTSPNTVLLEEAMERIETDVIEVLNNRGMLKNIHVRMSGAADKLTQTRESLQWNFILAAVISYLLMSALFGNFIYPLIIMFTVPLATAGGFIGLRLVNLLITSQPLDILTMLGFVILIGVVVNNAILIVHQSLNNVRLNQMEYNEAIVEAVRTRIRPIYMSAATSILAMLPLVVAPGPGSELYRGLGSVVIGGIALSTVFTVFVIPALLVFFIRMEKQAQTH